MNTLLLADDVHFIRQVCIDRHLPDARLIFAEWLEERGRMRLALAWRYLADRHPAQCGGGYFWHGLGARKPEESYLPVAAIKHSALLWIRESGNSWLPVTRPASKISKDFAWFRAAMVAASFALADTLPDPRTCEVPSKEITPMKLFHVARVTPTAGNGVLTLHAGDILADSLESAEIQARLMYPCNYDTGERLTCSESTQGITY